MSMWRNRLVACGLALGMSWMAAVPAVAVELPLRQLLETAILSHASAGNDVLPPQTRLEFVLPPDVPQTVERLVALQQDLRANLFAATIEDAKGQQTSFRGKVFALLDVPVPNRPLAPGDILKVSDFSTRALPAIGMGRFAVVDLQALIGQEVRRLLPEGRVVQSQSLQAPRAVKRGEKLTLSYRNHALEVTAPARALEDAGLGEPVKVLNINSNKTITGIARGDGRVEVGQ